MRKAIDTGLPEVAPIAWAAQGGRLLATAHVPIREDGGFETGAADAQLDLTLANLARSLEAAGGSLDDVLQVVIYLTDPGDAASVNDCWRRWFREPWPNRAVIGCAFLTVPGMRVEITATAWLPEP